MHNSNVIKLGASYFTGKVATSVFAADPATFPAGTAVRDNGGVLSKSTGDLIGISLGGGLVNGVKQVVVAKQGNNIPLLVDAAIAAEVVVQNITYTAKVAGPGGNAISINYDSGAADGAANVSVSDNAITVQIETAVTTADTIASAILSSGPASALVSSAVESGEGSTAQVAFGAAVPLTGGSNEGGLFVEIGKFAEVDTNGKAVESGTLTAAIYRSEVKTGITEDGAEVSAAYVDVTGRL